MYRSRIIAKYLDDGELPEAAKLAKRTVYESERYFLEDGILYHTHMPHNKQRNLVEPVIQQLAVPHVYHFDFCRTITIITSI